MREFDVRDGHEVQDGSVKVIFGEDGEYLRYSQGNDAFAIVDGDDVTHVYVKDIPLLLKALGKIDEFTVSMGDPDEEY